MDELNEKMVISEEELNSVSGGAIPKRTYSTKTCPYCNQTYRGPEAGHLRKCAAYLKTRNK